MSDGLIRLTYRLETSGDIPALAAKIASDQLTGTFTELPAEKEEMRARSARRPASGLRTFNSPKRGGVFPVLNSALPAPGG